MLGKLSWSAIPFDEPLPLISGAAVGFVILAVLVIVTMKGWWPYLWREWLTSVDHKHIGVMYVLLGLVMLLRGFSDAIMMRTQQAVAVGDAILVRAGEIVPIDGTITSAVAVIDEAALTGEPIPVARRTGEPVLSGTLNAGETFEMRATATAGASTYAGIVRMVTAAQTAKAPFIRVADRYALLLLPVLYVLSIGPVVAAVKRTGKGEDAAMSFYAPVIWLHNNTPLEKPLEWDAELWGWK